VPANRSRTENFLQNLRDIAERSGPAEVRFLGDGDGLASPVARVPWRVQLLRVEPSRLLISTPSAAGQTMPVNTGSALSVVYAIGQNRWTFQSRVLGSGISGDRSWLALEMPTSVSRCARRLDERATTMGQEASIRCWPLLDPTSARLAEVACAIRYAQTTRLPGMNGPTLVSEDPMPDVGPELSAALLNISGGGLGLRVRQEHAVVLDRHAFLFARLQIQGALPAPLAMTLRRVHSHLDSSGLVYVGCAFEFAFHAEHQRFLADAMASCIRALQGAITPRRSVAA
jgi:hypothetical protein